MSVTTIPSSLERGAGPGRSGRPAPGHKGSATLSWALAALFLALVVAAGWWVTHSAIFEARRITVSGNRHLTDEEVLRLAGVGGRTNVLWFSPGAVEDRLEGSPWIGSARVGRTLPSTVSITVTELSALAVMDSGETRYLIAGDGTVLGPASGHGAFPVIDLPQGPVRPGARVAAAMDPLWAIEALPPGVRSQVRRTAIEASGGLVLVLRGEVRAIYGDASEAAAKGQALAAILRWAERHAVALSSVDVRAPTTPVASPIAPAAPPRSSRSPATTASQ